MNVKKALLSIAISLATIASASAFAQAPAGSTGECKDGTYTSAKTERGACSRHGGVKTWFAQSKAAQESAKAPGAAAPAATAEAPAKPASKPAAKAAAKPSAERTEAAAGGGPGMVWVNTPTKVYHCSGDQWYGKTKTGEYMSEAQAKAKGYRPSHNKGCS